MKMYLVGGSVRDIVLNRESKDRDYAAETDYESLKTFLQEQGYTIIFEQPKFLTIRVRKDGEVIDFACCRAEAQYDGRRPESVEATTIISDLSRRDFTINAMALEVDPYNLELISPVFIDPHQGKTDLDQRSLRFVGNPEDRLKEDGLRWLRAVRFWITLGFQPTEETLAALMNSNRDILNEVSSERIQQELDKCFSYDPMSTIKILSSLPFIWLRPEIEISVSVLRR